MKPCPRCEGRGKLIDAKDGVSFPFRVVCAGCSAGTLCFNDKTDAVMDWNRGILDGASISDDVQDD